MTQTKPSLLDSARSAAMDGARLRLVRDFRGLGGVLPVTSSCFEPWLPQALDSLSAWVPTPKTVAPFIAAPFFRPPASYRSFYYCPGASDSPETESLTASLAIKGMEPLVDDVDALLRDLLRPCYTPHNRAEHFVFVEGKIPGCLSLREALQEAERAAELQRAHLAAYGAPARLPIPLFVFRHDDVTVERFSERLSRTLSAAAFRSVAPVLAEGLGVYVYYYQTAPIRARDVDHMLQGAAFRERLLALLHGVCDPEIVLRRWAQLFVRMLYLGFLPGSLAALRSGVCCQPQNACVDGGFVDLDSVTPLTKLTNEIDIHAALQFSVDCLIQSVRALIAGEAASSRPDTLEVRLDLHYLRQHVLALIEEAIQAEVRPAPLDPRIASYFSAPRVLDALVMRLQAYYGPSSEFPPASGEHIELALRLMRAARHS